EPRLVLIKACFACVAQAQEFVQSQCAINRYAEALGNIANGFFNAHTFTLRHWQRTKECSQKCRFPRAIRTKKADPLAFSDLEIEVRKEGAGTISYGCVLKLKYDGHRSCVTTEGLGSATRIFPFFWVLSRVERLLFSKS